MQKCSSPPILFTPSHFDYHFNCGKEVDTGNFRAIAASLVYGLMCQEVAPAETPRAVASHSQGLHGYIGFGHERFPSQSAFTAGGGFYAAVWSLVDQPLAGFQIGLPGMWIMPDNSNDKDTPLAPEGTLARTWKERGPTWDSRQGEVLAEQQFV